MNRRAMLKHFSIFPAAALAAALSGCGSQAPAPQPSEQPPLAGAAIGGPFTLSDKDGKAVTWDQFKGKYRIVYFGYTFCPDACPMDVGVMMRGFAKFEQQDAARAAGVQPIFITIDPARDTPARVGEFAAAFSPRLLGLTGTEAQVKQAAKAFRAYYARGQESAGGYLMDHSRIAYLMDPAGQPIAMLPVEKGADAVAAELARWVK